MDGKNKLKPTPPKNVKYQPRRRRKNSVL